MKTYPISKIVYNHIDEIWSIDLADFSDYETSNKEDLNIYLLQKIISVNVCGYTT